MSTQSHLKRVAHCSCSQRCATPHRAVQAVHGSAVHCHAPSQRKAKAAPNETSFYCTQVHELKLEAPFVACEDEKDRECVQCS